MNKRNRAKIIANTKMDGCQNMSEFDGRVLICFFFSAVDVFITKSTKHYAMNFTAAEYLKSLPSHACFATNPTENKRDKCKCQRTGERLNPCNTLMDLHAEQRENVIAKQQTSHLLASFEVPKCV